MNDDRRAARSRSQAGTGLRPVAGMLIAVACFITGASCLERRDDTSEPDYEARCATCHGDPSRPGDYLQRSAPPRDLSGASTPAYPGVGAHALHLNAGPTHGSVACNECHVVPEHSDSKGHADSARPAEIVFGMLARKDSSNPRYDPIARTCSGTACHGDHAAAVWTEPRSSKAACGSCHGLPPALPHPQSARCEVCHSQVIDEAGHFSDPSLHVDGVVETTQARCSACHGSGDEAAPPTDTQGNQTSRAVGVGAHRAHLSGGAFGRPLACQECHEVPELAEDRGHIEGLPARVVLSGVATSGRRKPIWDHEQTTCSNTWCHGPSSDSSATSPSWIDARPLGCTSCHGAPPPAPHPQLTNCSQCHGAVVAPDNQSFVDRTRHVDGVVDVAFDSSCTSCHGSLNPAPPFDSQGHRATSFAGVGAHQAHVAAGPRARAVPCAECHVVPQKVLAPGHIDTALPAEVRFAGVATAFDANPAYANGTCQGSACHGAKFPGTHRSGGTNTSPSWTKVDGSARSCGSCHGLPPPAPHPYQNDCSACHENMAKDNVDFVHPELHVDGVVTFTVP